MTRLKIDPHGAVRDMFDAESQADPPQEVVQVKKQEPARNERPEITGPATKFLTVDEVAKRYRVGKATVWRWVKNDPDFPEPFKLSAGTSRWAEEQLCTFECLAAKRSENKVKGQAAASGARVGKGAVK